MLSELLAENRASILDRWRLEILSDYSGETATFLQGRPDRFANPVGYAIEHATETLFDGLLAGKDARELSPALDELIRIRAVQQLSPSRSVGFIFQLKSAVRKAIPAKGLEAEIVLLESKIDALALCGFDIYTECRQKIEQIRNGQAARRTPGKRPRPVNDD